VSGVVDLHAHVFPPDLGPPPDSGEPWPELVRGADGGGVIRRGGVAYRTVGEDYWSVSARLDWLDRMGIERQVVSPLPVLLASWAAPRPAREHGRRVNEAIAAFCAAAPERLVGFGMVPLQAPELAVEELRRVKDLGLAGVEIGTRAGERELDDPAVGEFFRAAAALGMPLLMHPLEAAGLGRMDDPLVRFGVGVPADTAIAVTTLLRSGVLADLPHLRLCLCHGGGAFFWCLPRLRPLLAAAVGDERAAELVEAMRALYVDTAGLGEENLDFLLRLLAPEQLVVGSDFPATADRDPLAVTAAARFAQLRERMHRVNATSFLSGSALAEAC
jgi:aminocarboxymuconate-semialdehyde decarboxylase